MWGWRLIANSKSAAEVLDEAAADADVGFVFGDVFTLDPHGFGKFFLLHVDGVVAVEFSGKARNEGVAEGPRLRTEVADVFHAEPRFFHDFAVYGLFQAFTDFDKT